MTPHQLAQAVFKDQRELAPSSVHIAAVTGKLVWKAKVCRLAVCSSSTRQTDAQVQISSEHRENEHGEIVYIPISTKKTHVRDTYVGKPY